MDLLDSIALSSLSVAVRRRGASVLAEVGEATGETVEPTLEGLLRAADPDRDISATATAARVRAERTLADAARRDLQPLGWHDSRFPRLLSAIFDPPPALWLVGQIGALAGPAVAVVGSRAGSPYALEVAERLAADLAARGVTIVSGLARGVDSAAHRGALSVGGATVAVLGSGADVIYPPEHRGLAREIARSGAVVSEFPPGTPPRPAQFPLRNRLMSGMSLAVVVVEASEKSGSLITAGCALEQGRDVMVVPGSVLTGRNRGSHALLRDGAKIVESADDILEELGLSVPGRDNPRPSNEAPMVDAVLGSMSDGETYNLDELAAGSGIDAARLLSRLLALELAGHVRRVGGGRFARCRPK